MKPLSILLVMFVYFLAVLALAKWTSRGADNRSFFTGNRQSRWWLVSFGMVGASLSGVTFISVPGWVSSSSMAYMQMVLGYVLGYAVVAGVLLPLYYRSNSSTIYGYLGQRYNDLGQRSGAWLFLLSRWVGASLRLYLVAIVLQQLVFGPLGLPFVLTVCLILSLIWLYTKHGGIQTVVVTDVVQTLAMLGAIFYGLYVLTQQVDMGGLGAMDWLVAQPESQWFFFDSTDGNHFWQQFLAGMFITIAMTGLDQDMMQKNLTCRSLRESQINVMTLSLVLVVVNFMVLALGVLMTRFASDHGIDASGDALFPAVAMHADMPWMLGILFVIGLVAAAFSSADSALTALTTSLSVDVLRVEAMSPDKAKQVRQKAHVLVTIAVGALIVVLKPFADPSIIKTLFTAAGYTYGPLLGLFAYGILSQQSPRQAWLIPAIAVTSPLLTYAVATLSPTILNYTFGFELLLLNGGLTMTMLALAPKAKHP
jgi:Na+/proline symporter